MKEYRKPSILDTLNSAADRVIPAALLAGAALLGGYAAGRVVAKAIEAPIRNPQLLALECVLSN